MIAALLNMWVLHFGARPRHIAYLATYVMVMAGTMVILGWDRREAPRR